MPVVTAPQGRNGSTTVFANAAIFDGISYHRELGDVLVQRGRITAVGADRAPVGAVVIDVAAESDAYLARIRQYADVHSRLDWVQGGGWAMTAFPGGLPTAAALDEVVPDRPVALANRDHHGMWVNSPALQIAGISAATPDPADGRIERDATGQPIGVLHEGAMALLEGVLPAVDDDQMYAALIEGQRCLHSLGITGWQDAIVGSYSGMRNAGPTYARAAASGDLTGTVVGAMWWDRERGSEQIPELLARREAYTHGRFAATSVKIMQDGVAENGTAALVDPYLDRCGHATGNAGISFVDPERLRGHVRELDRHGFQVHLHGLGDRGVREALDALEGTDPARRHHVAHLQLVHPDDIARFGKLGVAANVQALWACNDDQMTELTIPFLGADRARRQYPFAELHAAGARIVAGSDWPVSTPDPLAAIHTAVHRLSYGEPAPAGTEPFHPEQALGIEAAFAAYTSGSAWVNHRDDAGTIAPGAVADLVVLDRDPFQDPQEIGAARVRSTWIDGQCVHEA